jgi:hypothetical protein
MVISCRMAGLPQFLLVIAAIWAEIIPHASHFNFELRSVPSSQNQATLERPPPVESASIRLVQSSPNNAKKYGRVTPHSAREAFPSIVLS